jgi:phage terminase large subunit-like protein
LKSLLETERRLGLEDFDFFNEHILGCRDLAEVHHELCHREQFGPKKQLTLIPRGHLKSTICTVGYTVWSIIKNPNIRILILNAKQDNAESFLTGIKGHFEGNEKLRHFYGDFVGKKWNEGEIVVAKRTVVLKEPTVLCAGVGASVVSKHFDLVIADDVVNETNTTTVDQIKKTIDWWGLMQSCGDGDQTQWIIIGTRYHYDDLYGNIIANKSDMYDVYIRKVYENGVLIYPQKFTDTGIEEIKREQGSYIYSCQYLNEPVDDESAIFRKSWLKYYEEDDLAVAGRTNTFITIDPAVAEGTQADETCFAINRVDQFGNWWVKLISGKMTPKELIDKMFYLDEMYQPMQMGIELHALQKILKYQIEDEMRLRDSWLPIVELKPDTRTKKERIRGLQPRFEYGTIYLEKNTHETNKFVDQYLRFPKASHDDMLDALAYQLDVAYQPKRAEKRKQSYKPINSLTGY